MAASTTAKPAPKASPPSAPAPKAGARPSPQRRPVPKAGKTSIVTAKGLTEIREGLLGLSPKTRAEVEKQLPAIVRFMYKVGTSGARTKAERKVVRGGGIRMQGTASIVFGGPSNAAQLMTLGTEYGGRRRRTTRQFRPFRGTKGYFFWPSIKKESKTIRKMWDQIVKDAIKAAIKPPGLAKPPPKGKR